MLQANELRIGNWVRHATHERIPEHVRGKYLQVTLDNLEDIDIAAKYHVDATYEGIPLTPEILEKLGAKLINYSDVYINYQLPDAGCISHCISDKYKDTAYGHSKDNWYYGDAQFQPVNYLHTLQNRYYSLYGHDLQITL